MIWPPLGFDRDLNPKLPPESLRPRTTSDHHVRRVTRLAVNDDAPDSPSVQFVARDSRARWHSRLRMDAAIIYPS
jgi:hypothetical protein